MPVLLDSGLDEGLAYHYGNPVTEARSLAAGTESSSSATARSWRSPGPTG